MTAQAARSYYFLKGEFSGRCEVEALSENDCTDLKKEEVQKELEQLLIDLVEPHMLHSSQGIEQTPTSAELIYLQAFRSLDDELERAVGGDIILFLMTFVIMCAFCCLVLGGTPCMRSRILLANGGIILVVLGMVAGYGLCAGFGWKFTQLQQILPFILIGVGVDDMGMLSIS
eukprot:SAG31_NODE_4328_length_3351_cov_1.759225_3_plen_173_part_00